MSEQTARLAHIVDDILLASQLSSGTLPIKMESFDPVELARATVETERARSPRETSIVLVSREPLPPVSGESNKARQVLVNLIDNAVKYSPEAGRVEVRLESDGAFVRFSVSDQGMGIRPSEHERIFDKFHRLDPHMAGGVGGTGLGLYICRELVRQMNGRIWVSSEPGAGAMFTFLLPAAKEEKSPRALAYETGAGHREPGRPGRVSAYGWRNPTDP